MEIRTTVIAFLSIILLTNCAGTKTSKDPAADFARKQRTAVQFQEAQARLSDAAYPVLKENQELCKRKVSGLTGFDLLTLDQLSKKMRVAYASTLNVGERATVTHVVPGSPADHAGLTAGDVISEINGRDIRSGKKGLADVIFAVSSSASAPITVTVSRAESPQEVSFTPDLGCAFDARAMSETTIEPGPDGGYIGVSRKLISKASTPGALAFLVARQLSFYTSGAYQVEKSASVLGLAAGVALSQALKMNEGGVAMGMSHMASNIKDQKRQAKADRFGVFHLARAGFDLGDVVRAWETASRYDAEAIGLENDDEDVKRERLEQLRLALFEVEGNIIDGRPLAP